jgi:hypothetical protein
MLKAFLAIYLDRSRVPNVPSSSQFFQPYYLAPLFADPRLFWLGLRLSRIALGGEDAIEILML